MALHTLIISSIIFSIMMSNASIISSKTIENQHQERETLNFQLIRNAIIEMYEMKQSLPNELIDILPYANYLNEENLKDVEGKKFCLLKNNDFTPFKLTTNGNEDILIAISNSLDNSCDSTISTNELTLNNNEKAIYITTLDLKNTMRGKSYLKSQQCKSAVENYTIVKDIEDDGITNSSFTYLNISSVSELVSNNFLDGINTFDEYGNTFTIVVHDSLLYCNSDGNNKVSGDADDIINNNMYVYN